MMFIIRIAAKALRKFGHRRDRNRISGAQLKLAQEQINYYKNKDFEGIKRYMMNFKWTRDDMKGFYDYAKEPVVMVADKKGDCDDFAALWSELLGDRKKQLFAVINKKASGHVMLAVENKGKFYVMSNRSYSYMGNNSIEESIKIASETFYDNVFKIILYDEEGFPKKTLKMK